ncbi:MAG TPA: hypothetical protein EYG03_28925 [Planctomycetes bacterium]|nr:hypothetical protein [Fuerstiella sp.]HIK95987.1 hypothetical protein [Planctomycetota bacterium]
MNTRLLPIATAADATVLASVILCLFAAGCGGNEDLGGRVAVDVTVQIGGEAPESGTLVLKPEPGVKSPLIRIIIADGAGSLPAAKGPVPGGYNASFRSSATGESIDEQLTKAGRQMPTTGARVSNPQTRRRIRQSPVPKGDVSVSVPDEDPATLTVSFDAA